MKARTHAFSFIECLLALGIISSVVLVIVAFLPVGMDTTRTCDRRTAEARILAQVRPLCMSTLPEGNLLFNDTGAPVSKQGMESIYAVRLETADAPPLPGDAVPALRRVKVTISDQTGVDAFTHASHLHVHHLLFAPP